MAFEATAASVWFIFPWGARHGGNAGGDGVALGGGVVAPALHAALIEAGVDVGEFIDSRRSPS